MKRGFAVLGVLLAVVLSGCAGGGGEAGALPVTSETSAGEATMPPGEPAKPQANPLLPSIEHTKSSAAQRAADDIKNAAGQVKDAANDAKTLRKAAGKLTFTMPKLVGKNLQRAQDDLQALNSYVLDEEDATGAGRIQVVDTDWKVCSQKPKAGTKVAIVATVKLSAVKLSEKCP